MAAGAALGVMASILFAPMKGKDLRGDMRMKGKKILGELQEKMRSQGEKMKGMKEKMLETMSEA